MRKFLVAHILNTSGVLDSYLKVIDAVVDKVDSLFNTLLAPHWQIDVIFSGGLNDMVIPEDGVGGRTPDEHTVIIAIDTSKEPCSSAIEDMLIHELGHAIFFKKSGEKPKTFIEFAIHEGVAICVQEYLMEDSKYQSFFLKTIQTRYRDDQLINELANATDKLWQESDFDYAALFFGGEDGGFPRWTGYSLGYFIVKRVLECTGMNIFQVLNRNFRYFVDLYLETLPS